MASRSEQGNSLHHARLRARAALYAIESGASQAYVDRLLEMLDTPLGQYVLSLPDSALHAYLIQDAYKVRMHVMYARYMTGVSADFALNVRRSALALADVRSQMPGTFARLAEGVAALQRTPPYPPPVVEVVREYMGLELPQAVLQRASVAPVLWQECAGQLRAIASGPIDAASNVETSCMQLVQQHLLTAQAQAPRRPPPSPASAIDEAGEGEEGEWPDRTERLANSLGRMAATVEALNRLDHGCSITLMAGRRSSDVAHLLLQNLFFMRHAEGYCGTSAIAALALLQPALKAEGMDAAARKALVRQLSGTHAHELGSAVQQLMGAYDARAGELAGEPGPLCVTQLLSHLLFLAANGSGGGATALPDTFTTAAFVAAAACALVPSEFAEDMAREHGERVAPGARVFDLFRLWRLDSGDYAASARLVVAAWRARCAELEAEGRPPLPPPRFMHSNVGTVEDVREVLALPQELRPRALGFGGLADGFVPFHERDGAAGSRRAAVPDADAGAAAQAGPVGRSDAAAPPAEVTLSMANLVMKLVQARLPGSTDGGGAPAARPQACAVKLGDEFGGKVQADPRLPPPEAKRICALIADMAARTAARAHASGPAISAALADAYCAVTRQGVLLSG